MHADVVDDELGVLVEDALCARSESRQRGVVPPALEVTDFVVLGAYNVIRSGSDRKAIRSYQVRSGFTLALESF